MEINTFTIMKWVGRIFFIILDSIIVFLFLYCVVLAFMVLFNLLSYLALSEFLFPFSLIFSYNTLIGLSPVLVIIYIFILFLVLYALPERIDLIELLKGFG